MNRFKIALMAIFAPKRFSKLFIDNDENAKEAAGLLAEFNWRSENAFRNWASSNFDGYHNDPISVSFERKYHWREATAYCHENNIEVTRKRNPPTTIKGK